MGERGWGGESLASGVGEVRAEERGARGCGRGGGGGGGGRRGGGSRELRSVREGGLLVFLPTGKGNRVVVISQDRGCL